MSSNDTSSPRAPKVVRAIGRHTAGLISAAGCIAFGAAALADSKRIGERCGLDVDTTRVVGARDLILGALLVVKPSGPAFLARAAVDAGDTVMLARRRPLIAAIAGAFSVFNGAIARAFMRSR